MNADLKSLSHGDSVTQNPPVARSTTRSLMTAALSLFAIGAAAALSPSAQAQHYLQTNLVSDIPGLAAVTHVPLVNPWGLVHSATSPWWVSDNGAGVSTLYTGAGAPLGLVVTVPVPLGGTPPSTPTGIVFNGSSDFQVAASKPAHFIFVTEDGTISGWNSGASAVLMVDHSGAAVYKGATLGVLNGANLLYVANFRGGTVDVYDKNFAPMNLGAGAFWDPKLPAGFAPFGIQNLNGMIFVSYAKQDAQKHDEVDGRKLGYVNAYSPAGVLLMRLQNGPWMNAPWGLAWSPANFGEFSNMILVGQFGSGNIAAFDPQTGEFQGLLHGKKGALVIDGLWGLSFGNGASAGPVDTLYFTAGINGEADGLFGTLTAIPGDDGGDDSSD